MADNHATAGDTVQVLLPLPVPGPYDYHVPEGVEASVGAIVRVPLGNRIVTGVVWGHEGPDVDRSRLRPIEGVWNVPPLKKSLLRFVTWVARYTVNAEGAVLRMVLRSREALEPPPGRRALRLAGRPPERITPQRQRVLSLMADGSTRPVSDVAAEAGVSVAVLKGLVETGSFETVLMPPAPVYAPPDPEAPGPKLRADQRTAAARLAATLDDNTFAPTLLEGVTGSGKTEVYFDAIARVLATGRQVLVLLPEIALSAQFLNRFEERFQAPPAIWHSDVPRSRRHPVWRGAATGEVRIVVGARSALFLPFQDLGLIVVDEEHDSSYKQEDGVCYHARDMAIVRAHLETIPIILCSATPSIETLVNVDRGRFRRVELKARHAGALLPDVRTIDMTTAGVARDSWLSGPLVRAMTTRLEAGEQTLLFLNRRGYAPLTLCRACGHRFSCPDCTAWLVEHRYLARLQCHHCGRWIPRPQTCPVCAQSDCLVACGPGVERLDEEVARRFPDARREVMTSDTLAGPHAVAELVKRIESGGIDILIGTQIAAKGHHFPLLTLVGVVDADLGLHGGDPRAMERTWQLLHQVAGRAGREERPGEAFLQTWDPAHPVMHALETGARDTFIEREKREREKGGMPPYGRLAAVIVSGTREGDVRSLALFLARKAPSAPDIRTFGPAPAPLAILRGRHRWRLLVKASAEAPLQRALRTWLDPVRLKGDLRLQIDVDPQSFM